MATVPAFGVLRLHDTRMTTQDKDSEPLLVAGGIRRRPSCASDDGQETYSCNTNGQSVVGVPLKAPTSHVLSNVRRKLPRPLELTVSLATAVLLSLALLLWIT